MRAFRFKPKVSPILGLGVTLLLLLAIACGAAATATPAPKAAAPAAPAASAAEAKPAPVLAATPTPVPAATPAPTPTLAAAPKVHPDKVTLMVVTFGNERFDGNYGSTGKDYFRAIHGFLVSSDVKDGRKVVIPGIATKWEMSSDGLTWTFTIRKGVKFHDGTELTAEDVLWSLRHNMGPQAKEYSKSSVTINFSNIMDRIEQTGPDQVSVTTKVPSPEVPGYIGEGSGGASVGIVHPKRAALHDVQEAAAYDRKPIAAGIIKLVKHVPLEVMAFERFADYYHQPKNGFPTDKRLNFAVMDLRQVPEEATRVAALRAGEADIARVSLGARKQLEAGGGRLVFAQEGVAFEINLVGCWESQFPCHDRRVRQALNYAIDKELMRDKLYGGPEVMQAKGWWVMTPSTIGYSPELDPFPYDPAKARQLLADAGYPGGKGFGKLVINTFEDLVLPLMPESAQLGADFWRRELGLDVEVKVGSSGTLQTAFILTTDLNGQVLWRANDGRIDGAGIVRVAYLTKHARGPWSRVHGDPELFALVQKALAVLDPIESEKTFNSLYRRLREEAYNIPLGYINIPWGVGPRIATWQPYPVSDYASALHTITLK